MIQLLPRRHRRPSILMAAVLAFATNTATAEQPLTRATTGPAIEPRFPPLVVPQGFKATLFASDPLVEYLSAVALGPQPGSLFVVADWVLAHAGGPAVVECLFDLAANDPELGVQVQAIRAIADLTDPVMKLHRLDSGPGDAEVAERLVEFAEGNDARVLLDVVIALGAAAMARGAGLACGSVRRASGSRTRNSAVGEHESMRDRIVADDRQFVEIQ